MVGAPSCEKTPTAWATASHPKFVVHSKHIVADDRA